MARIAVGGFQHETNTFAKEKADLEDFEKGGGPLPPLTRGPALLEIIGGANIPIAGFVEEARGRGHEMVPLLLAGTMPSGHVTRRAYETAAASAASRSSSIFAAAWAPTSATTARATTG